MTVKTTTRDDRISYPTRFIAYPSGVETSGTPALIGYYTQKQQNGGDYGSKPTYKFIYWREPATIRRLLGKKNLAASKVKVVPGRLHRKRIRTDSPVRTKTTPHPYTMSLVKDQNVPVVQTFFNPDGSLSSKTICSSARSRPPTGSGPLNAMDNNDKIAIIGKLRTKIAGSDFNVGVMLAEGHQTLMMIASIARRIDRAYRSLEHGNFRDAAQHLLVDPKAYKQRRSRPNQRELSSLWLELQYGWKPLLSDVKAGAEFVAKLVNFPYCQTYRVRTKKALVYSWDTTAWQEDRKGSVDCLQIIARISEVDVPQLVGLTDPLSIVWEKTPYSFVADWFIPIGNWLSARGLASAVTGEYVTTIYTRERCSWLGLQAPSQICEVYSGGSRPYGEIIQVKRTVSSFLSVPTPNFKTLGQAASWEHCANAVALLTQRFKSFGRSIHS